METTQMMFLICRNIMKKHLMAKSVIYDTLVKCQLSTFFKADERK